MSIFKKKDKEATSLKLSNKKVDFSTTSKKEAKKVEKKKEQKKENQRRFKDFFKSMIAEGKKVTWPTWKKTLVSTAIVLLVVLLFTLLILSFDLIFSQILSLVTGGKLSNPAGA